MVESVEKHPAVKLILSRMESSPEEFLGVKWNPELNKLRELATPEEVKAIEEKLCQIKLDQVHKDIMKKLTAPVEKEVARVKTLQKPLGVLLREAQERLEVEQCRKELAEQIKAFEDWRQIK